MVVHSQTRVSRRGRSRACVLTWRGEEGGRGEHARYSDSSNLSLRSRRENSSVGVKEELSLR